MKIINRLFATAFVGLLLVATHSSAEHEGSNVPAPVCESGEAETACS